MEQIITPDKEKVTKLAHKLAATITIYFITMFVIMFAAMFIVGAFSLASKHSISLLQAVGALAQGLQESAILSPVTLIGIVGLFITVISPIFNLKSAFKNGKFQVLLNKEGITSQVGSIKKFVAWDKFTQIVPTKYPGRVWMSRNNSGKIFILDVFDFSELNSQISTYRNKQSQGGNF